MITAAGACLLPGCGSESADPAAATGGTGGAGGGGVLTLTSPAFDDIVGCSETSPGLCDTFPNENIAYMQNPNVSPELDWTGAPAGTQSFAITLHDLTYGQPHWAIWNIPGTSKTLPANLPKDSATPTMPAGSRQCNATFAEGDGYFGPVDPCNVYQFELFALSTSAFSPTQPEYAAVVRSELLELGDAVLARDTLTGRTNYMMTCQ